MFLLIEHFSITDDLNHVIVVNTDRDETGDIGDNDEEENQSIIYYTF